MISAVRAEQRRAGYAPLQLASTGCATTDSTYLQFIHSFRVPHALWQLATRFSPVSESIPIKHHFVVPDETSRRIAEVLADADREIATLRSSARKGTSHQARHDAAAPHRPHPPARSGDRSMSTGKSVRLFLADGTPGGLLTAEIMNWTGHIVAAPRSDLAALLKRPETGRTGIYILIGDDPESVGGQMAYVGEGDDVSKRLYQHATARGPGRQRLLGPRHRHHEQGHQPHEGSRPLSGEPLHLPRIAGEPSQADQLHGTGADCLARSGCVRHGVLHRAGAHRAAGPGRQHLPLAQSPYHRSQPIPRLRTTRQPRPFSSFASRSKASWLRRRRSTASSRCWLTRLRD